MKKIIEANSYRVWEHRGMYCVYRSFGEPNVHLFNWTDKDVIRPAVMHPGLPQYADLDAAIIDYFDHDLVTMTMLESL